MLSRTFGSSSSATHFELAACFEMTTMMNSLPSKPSEKRFTTSAPPRALTPNLLVIETPPAEMRFPTPPAADFGRRFRWPGAIEISIQFRDAANGARPLAVPFGVPEESVKERK